MKMESEEEIEKFPDSENPVSSEDGLCAHVKFLQQH